MGVNNNFPIAKFKRNYDEDTIRQIVQSVRHAMLGNTNNTGEVKLTAGAASTVVIDNRCTTNSVVLLQPKTANAAAAIATTYPVTGEGTFTLNHANNGQTDKDFKYVIVG
ncbi:MAG: hypothetical protein E6Q97_09285 [Desulfurellales bacterium]|nr:MAG: hypothetical protein E6Q97_09285 [Desulfurellales bacterium]